MYLTLHLRSVVVKPQPVGALPTSSDSSQLFGWVVASLVFEALVSRNCPWVVLASGALLHPVLLLLGEVTEALAVVVVALGYPTGRSTLRLDQLAVLVPAVVRTRTGTTQTAQAALAPAVPLGQVEAIVEMAVLSPCNTREELWKDASRPLYRRLLRRIGSAVEGCCSAKSYL
jgi:hypothetical protein